MKVAIAAGVVAVLGLVVTPDAMVNGDQATVKVKLGGTQSGSLTLPGFPSIPASGKKVAVMDGYIVTVQGDKIPHFQVDSPADGGIPAMLVQLGVKMPAM